VTAPLPVVSVVHARFIRHHKQYCFFSVEGRTENFVYFSHPSEPLRSFMLGNGFLDQLPGLMKKEDLCIECSLGLSIDGGVVLDGSDLRVWHATVEEADAILAALKEKLGKVGDWIILF
jgi:hypothetical protein